MELLQNLAEFLKIDIKQENSVDSVFLVTLKYLDKLKANDFEYELLIPLRGVLNKFANCANFHGVENIELSQATDDFINTVNQTTYRPVVEEEGGFIDFFGKKSKKNIITKANAPIYQKFQNLYNVLIATYNLVKDGQPKSRDLDLEGFYNPNHANKSKAKQLLIIAREQLERNLALAAKPKKSLNDFITKAVMEFDKPNSNWTLIFGRLKEVVTVLNALESLANSIKGASTLSIARMKIEEAIQVVDQTSININYKTMNHIFNIEEGSLLIESQNPTLQIEPVEVFNEAPPITTIIEPETNTVEAEVNEEVSIQNDKTTTNEPQKEIEPKTEVQNEEAVLEAEPVVEVEEIAEVRPAKKTATKTVTATKIKTAKTATKAKTTKPKTTRTRKKKAD